MPSLNELHKTYADKGLVVIGIHKPMSSDKAEDFKKEVTKLNIAYPVVIDADGQAETQWGKNGKTYEGFQGDEVAWPPTFLMDRTGKVHKTVAGKFHTKARDDKPECEQCEKKFADLKKDIESLLEPKDEKQGK